MMLHLNIFPLDVTVADRWFYFPSVGLLGIIGLGLMAGTRSLLALTPARRDLVLVFGIGILLVLSVRTFVRVFDWRDGLTLATREVRYSKDSFPLENNLAYELINANRYEEALVHAKRSTALGPWWWLNWTNLGVIYRHLGKTDLAIESFGRGADNTDVFLVPYENKAEMLINYRSPEETVSYIVKSSKKAGTSGRLLFLLALALSQTGDTKGALDSAHRAVLADPADAKAQMLYEGLKAGKKVQIGKTVY
jgi:tetratricopeptide (TPR) repeat protein